MRFLLTIKFQGVENKFYSFQNSLIKEYLNVGKNYSFDSNINLTTLQYNRDKPGLIEMNWSKPFFNNEKYFLFIAGHVLYRNNCCKDNPVPRPFDIFNILLDYNEEHYNYLKGTYYLLLFNKQSKVAKLFSSPMFMFPAFYSFIDNRLIFTNHIECFSTFFTPEIDRRGLLEYALFDHTLHTRTIYKQIKNVQGGYLTEFSLNGIKEKLVYDIAKWFNLNPVCKKDALPLINNSLKKSINDWAASADYFNSALTGGFDGRLNLALIEPVHFNKMKLFSYGMPGSRQILIPEQIAKKLSLNYEPVLLDEEFTNSYIELGLTTILLTCGITGFNRAVYPYAYDKIKNYSRSCLIGQCDMIRPLYNNPAGVIWNDFSFYIFFGRKDQFLKASLDFKNETILDKSLFDLNLLNEIYDEIKYHYIDQYLYLSEKIRFYFFLLKESLMKYWHTEFHAASIFVDDYASFADLDYLELLFNSQYAGIYKGIMAKNQFQRQTPHDLYVDLMTLNNNKLNYFYTDRFFKPSWLKYGKLGWLLAGAAKNAGNILRAKKNDTFNSRDWAIKFYDYYKKAILEYNNNLFNKKMIDYFLINISDDSGIFYRFNRMISLKLWLDHFLK